MRLLFPIFLLLALSLEAKERIISLSPALTEILFALGVGENVVGVNSYSLYPPKAQKLPIIGSYTQPNLEKILELTPTLVIGQDFNYKAMKDLDFFGIKTVSVSLQGIKDIKDSIALLGKKLSQEKKARQLIETINIAMQDAKRAQKPHTVLIVYGLQEDLRNGIYIAGHDIVFEDIILLSGNYNAYSEKLSAQPVLNYENIIALNPEQIIILHSLASAPNIDVQKALKNWYHLPTKASKNGRISIVDADYIHIPSHRIAQSITRLSNEMRGL
ncbi:MAG: helical backbone metal receptor [Campylobacterota bacterium]|nr:helical backbone metal receptor [Campylobacterota bacterium]